MTADRQKVIAAVLIHHATIGSGCSCGHRFRIGDSMSAHRAEAIDTALDELSPPLDEAEQLAAIDQGLTAVEGLIDAMHEASPRLFVAAHQYPVGAHRFPPHPTTIDPALPHPDDFRRSSRPPHTGIAGTYADNGETVPTTPRLRFNVDLDAPSPSGATVRVRDTRLS